MISTRILQLGGHQVELAGQLRRLRVAPAGVARRDAAREVAAAEPAGRLGQALEGTREAAGDDGGDGE